MKARLIHPDGTETTHTYKGEPTLGQMKNAVGGYIELVGVLHEGKRCHMVVNEDGIALNLPPNKAATEIYYAASRARGVEPTDKASREADARAGAARIALGLGINPEDMTVISLGDTSTDAPMIRGSILLLDGMLS